MAAVDATELAQFLSNFVGRTAAFPAEAVEDLRRLLAHDLATYNVARLRLGQLRLLMEMLSASNSPEPFITTTEYMAEQKRRERQGEHHPSETTLRANYGHWLKAVQAASRFMALAGVARPQSRPARVRPSRSYSLTEIASALLRCHHDLRDWPTEWEYTEWSAIKRSIATTDLRLPSAIVIRKTCGTFPDALDTVRANYQASQRNTS